MPTFEQSNNGIVVHLTLPNLTDVLNRLQHSGAYFAYYLALWAWSIPLVVVALLDSSWRGFPVAFYLIQFLVNSSTLVEVYLRASHKGPSFLVSGASLLDVIFCTVTLITWSLSLVAEERGLVATSAAIGAISLLVRGIFQFLRLGLVILRLAVKKQQDGGESPSDSDNADIDNFDIRDLFGSATDRTIRGLEEVLITSFKRGVLGTIRIVQLVVAIVAVVLAFDDVSVLVIIQEFALIFEAVTVLVFRSHLNLYLPLVVLDELVCLLGSVTAIIIARDGNHRHYWSGPALVTRIFTIVTAFVFLARSVIQLLYFVYSIFLSCKIVFQSSETIRLLDEDDNSKAAGDESAGSARQNSESV
ncbi:hypothetical protein OE88DRAFT_1658853 [Heliocybe sulcata]|uniref:Transmembrane protein n=1 Tax=Heliocybe sulcata TaxID=5364 RepID=A0A5C3N2W1_9AGAM|nr:hypothetical protein OE88DRAFT_1658853 [Heliocybe sulcata]